MATTIIFTPLSNTLQFPQSSTKIPRAIFSSKSRTINLTTSSTQTNKSDDNNIKISSIECETEDFESSSKPYSNSGSVIKVPTAPWMKGPLLVEPSQVLDFSKLRTKKGSSFGKLEKSPDEILTGKVGAGRGKREMKKIFQGIKKLQENTSSEETQKDPGRVKFKFSPGELWGDRSSDFDEEEFFEKESKLVETQKGMEDIVVDFVVGEVEGGGKPKFGGKMPWDREEKLVVGRLKKEKMATAAELSLDKELRERLRGEAASIRKWVKVMKAGVTQDVVDQVHSIWKHNELAMLKFDLPLSRNMDRAREILEMKTGGLVVWRRKDALVIYRGLNNQSAVSSFSNISDNFAGGSEIPSFSDCCRETITISQVNSSQHRIAEMMSDTDNKGEKLLVNRSLYEKEADRLLDGFGPRFVDWWGPKPLPVDADLLAEVVPGFRPPFRLCPPSARSKLQNEELTFFRKLAQSLPTHFVLGRNRKLQGLAVAMLKLWEKCHIAKIAVKWGTPNTDHRQMAYELKCLTGGVLLLCNKFFIILYRGKDFLPSQVAELVAVRELQLARCQMWEETSRLRASGMFSLNEMHPVQSGIIGTLSEFQNIQSEYVELTALNSKMEVQVEVEKERLEKELKTQERKLFILKKKMEKSAKRLAELNSAWRPAEQDVDQEMMTQEERECLRQMGLKMEATLVLGRRGVFQGVIESLYQHWKHREIVKVITMQRMFSQVTSTAKLLEAESRGILVSIEKLKKGHAIIVYRGKNYRRPKLTLPKLLSKRESLSRSLEMQRMGSLKFFANQSEQTISNLKSKLAELMKQN